MQRSSVDLPLPDGPMMQTTSPVATDRSMPLQHVQRAEMLVQPVDLDHRPRAGHVMPAHAGYARLRR